MDIATSEENRLTFLITLKARQCQPDNQSRVTKHVSLCEANHAKIASRW